MARPDFFVSVHRYKQIRKSSPNVYHHTNKQPVEKPIFEEG
jgi:hypothetical protein